MYIFFCLLVIYNSINLGTKECNGNAPPTKTVAASLTNTGNVEAAQRAWLSKSERDW